MFRRSGSGKNDKDFEEKEVTPFNSSKKEGFEVPTRIFEPLSRNENEGKRPPDWLNYTDKTAPLPHPLQGFAKHEEPETTLGEGVTFRGQLHFERLLRIDGHFEGELISQGKIIVGPKGVVKSNLDLSSAVIEGVIEGNITVKGRLELRGEAKVYGDIKARTILVDDGVTLVGSIYVEPSEDLESTMEPFIPAENLPFLSES